MIGSFINFFFAPAKIFLVTHNNHITIKITIQLDTGQELKWGKKAVTSAIYDQEIEKRLLTLKRFIINLSSIEPLQVSVR